MTAALACTGLNAGYVAGRPVVRDFELSAEPGQIVALVGPNGAGKTTLMMTIAGLLPALSGSVAISGNAVKKGNARAAVKAGLVLVPDDRALFRGLTVTENLRLAGHRGGTTVAHVCTQYDNEPDDAVRDFDSSCVGTTAPPSPARSR